MFEIKQASKKKIQRPSLLKAYIYNLKKNKAMVTQNMYGRCLRFPVIR